MTTKASSGKSPDLSTYTQHPLVNWFNKSVKVGHSLKADMVRGQDAHIRPSNTFSMLPSPTGTLPGVMGIPSTHNRNPKSSKIPFFPPMAHQNTVFPNQPENEKLWPRQSCIWKQHRGQLQSSGKSDSAWPCWGLAKRGRVMLALSLGPRAHPAINYLSHSLISVWRLAAIYRKGNVKISV